MTTNEALRSVERFMTGWNGEHFYQNVLDIQAILCLDDNEEKLRRLRRRQKSLGFLQSDLTHETRDNGWDYQTRKAFKSLLNQVQDKLDIVDKAIVQLTDKLVSGVMTTWLDAVMSETTDFSGAGYDGEAADFMSKW